MPDHFEGKVLGIGLSRTGTHSLTTALKVLGYKATHTKIADRQGNRFSLDFLKRFDAATDTPIAANYQYLDRVYPGSRFILTIRDKVQWVHSCSKYFATKHKKKAVNEFRVQLYGSDTFQYDCWTEKYDSFHREVYEYFEHRKRDLLVFNVAAGEGYFELCTFLGKPVPIICRPYSISAQAIQEDPGLRSYIRRFPHGSKMQK